MGSKSSATVILLTFKLETNFSAHNSNPNPLSTKTKALEAFTKSLGVGW